MNRTFRTTMALTSLLMAATGTALSLHAAEPPMDPPARPEASGDSAPENMKEHLDRALKETEQAQEKMRTAIERLNRGEDPAVVRRELDMPLLRLFLSRDAQGGPMGPGGRFRERSEERRPDEFMPGEQRGPEGGRRFEPGQASRPMGPDRLGRPGEPRGPGGGPGGPGGGPGVRGGPEGPDGPGPGGRGDLGPGDRDRLMAAMERDIPEFAARVKEVREKHPQLADRMFQRLAPRVRDVLKARETDPELFKLRLEELKDGLSVLEAIHASRQAQLLDDKAAGTAAKRSEAEKALRDAVSNAFDQRLKLDEHEATRVNERLNDIRAEIEKKKAGKDAAVDDIVRRISRGEMPPP